MERLWNATIRGNGAYDGLTASRPSSRRGSYRDYYDQPLIDGIRKLYRRDFELFGYDF